MTRASTRCLGDATGGSIYLLLEPRGSLRGQTNVVHRARVRMSAWCCD